jgi:hypothetical protein
MMDTVAIEYMLINPQGSVIMNWTKVQGSIQNDPQIYVPRALNTKMGMNTPSCPARVRVVSEQTGRIVDMFP